ncbi:MAG: chitobiase/beta-hexosaminidase C-terminal domain-containing protein [Bacteroides sp.]|nr:chitobiase/beta-hexosaminidase C-terminal domain-containing protein [Bacteroides sp.]
MKKLSCRVLTTLSLLFATIGLATAQTLTFQPESGSSLKAGAAFTVVCSDASVALSDIWYITYATLDEAQKQAPTSFANYNVSYNFGTPYGFDPEMPVVAAAILDKPETITYAVYKLEGAEEPDPGVTVAAPTFNPAGGEVEPNSKVMITCATNGATIHYTTDNSTPSASSTEYTTPIEITEAVTIKAIAVLDGKESEVAEAAYTIKQPLSVTVTFNPVSGSKVPPGTTFTVSGTHNDAGNGMFYFKSYATKADAEADDWSSSNPQAICMNGKTSPSREIPTATPIIKVAAKIGTGWSDFFYAEYIIETAEEPENPGSGKATIRLTVNGENCPYTDRHQYQLLLDANHTMADTYKEELDKAYFDPNLLSRLYDATTATIPAGITAENIATGVDPDKETSIEVEAGVYDIFLLQSFDASWGPRNVLRSVYGPSGQFYVDNITIQENKTYNFLVTFDKSGAHAELVIPIDLQLTAILGENKPSCEAESMEVSLAVSNIGSTEVTTYEAYYAVGTDTVRETVTSALAAGESTVFTFARKLALNVGEKTNIKAWILAKDEIMTDNNTGEYIVYRSESNPLPLTINSEQMHTAKASDWTLDENKALVASENATTPVFLPCFHVEHAGTYRLSYEYICGRFVELPDGGGILINNVDVYKICVGKTSQDWKDWSVAITDSTITGSSNQNEFTSKEISFEIEEPGDYAFCIFAERVNDNNNLKFRNLEIDEISAFSARLTNFNIRLPRLIPQDWTDASWQIDVDIENRGLQKLQDADFVISVNGTEATRQKFSLDVEAKQTLSLDVPVSGFHDGEAIKVSGNVLVGNAVVGKADAQPEITVTKDIAAFDHISDFTAAKTLQGYNGGQIGLIYPVAAKDTLTALAIGWGEMPDNMDIGISIQKVNVENDEISLGDIIYETKVRRGLPASLQTYDIPAFLLEAGNYFISVAQLGMTSFKLAMDESPEGGFFLFDKNKNTWNYYTQAGYPAIRAIFGSNGKLLSKDAMVSAISKPIDGGVFTSNEPIVVKVRNNGTDAVELPVYVRVDNTLLEPQTVALKSYESKEITFRTDLAAQNADRNITITAFTSLAGDEDPDNDTLRKKIVSFVPADPYKMDFESCLDFATEGLNPTWTSVSLDKTPVLPLRHVLDGEFHYVEFPGSETDLGFIVFNPVTTEPSMLFYDYYNNCRSHSGQRFGVSLGINDEYVPKDDWLISPKLKMPKNTQLSMWVKSFDKVFKETYEIWVSEGLGNPESEDFQCIYPGEDDDALRAGGEWENVTFDLSQFDNKEIHVAIRCVSADAPMFMIDDIVIGSNVSNEEEQNADFRISAYPNPATETVSFISPDAYINEVALFNTSGVLIHRSATNLSSNNYRYNVRGLVSGLYFARILTDKGTVIRKFMVR